MSRGGSAAGPPGGGTPSGSVGQQSERAQVRHSAIHGGRWSNNVAFDFVLFFKENANTKKHEMRRLQGHKQEIASSCVSCEHRWPVMSTPLLRGTRYFDECGSPGGKKMEFSSPDAQGPSCNAVEIKGHIIILFSFRLGSSWVTRATASSASPLWTSSRPVVWHSNMSINRLTVSLLSISKPSQSFHFLLSK